MIISTSLPALQLALQGKPPFDPQTGFVPTMGALHQGHLSLVNAARKECATVVASIFVNPTQFNDPGDFARYPKTVEQDILFLEQAGCQVLLLPSVEDIYPSGTRLVSPYQLGRMEDLLEGKYRPGHFQGVCQVVHLLLEAVKPGKLFMGRKDYQQCMVIQRLLQLTGLPVELHVVPTIREPDGLAMSSRNTRLNKEARQQSVGIFQQLSHIAGSINTIPLRRLEQEAIKSLVEAGFDKVDYVSIADAETLEPAEAVADRPLVALIAAFLDGVRLIDNMQVFTP